MTNRANVQKELAGWFGGSMEHLDFIATYNLINNVANLVSDGTACAMTLEGAVNFLDPQKFTSGRFRRIFPQRPSSHGRNYRPSSARHPRSFQRSRGMQKLNNDA